MARIYDNIETKFTQGLQDIITNMGVKRVDFCVGYFNLRGWQLVVNQIDQIPGDYVYEGNRQEFRCCRLLCNNRLTGIDAIHAESRCMLR